MEIHSNSPKLYYGFNKYIIKKKKTTMFKTFNVTRLDLHVFLILKAINTLLKPKRH